MRVAVIDVGSNTIRLLVAEPSAGGLTSVAERKARVGLGAEVERYGRISNQKLVEASVRVRELARAARVLRSDRIEIVVASPGRQAANSERLVRELARESRAPVRVLSCEEEALLAFEGVLAGLDAAPAGSVAVCDVGGGSTQVAIGTAEGGPVWLRSVDIGSLRLTTRLFGDEPPGKKAMKAARNELREGFEGFAPPLPQTALAVGGSARALRRLVGRRLGPDSLDEALSILRSVPAAEVASKYGVDRARVRTLVAGALILGEVQQRLGVPFEVARGGLREGVALSLLSEVDAA